MITIKLEKYNHKYSDNSYYFHITGNNSELVYALNRLNTLSKIQNIDSADALNDFYDKKIAQLKEIYNGIVSEIQQLKQQHKMPLFFYKQNYKKVKQLKTELEKISNACNLLESKKEDRYEGTPSKFVHYCSYKYFIENNNFVITNSTCIGRNHNDIYQHFGDEKELLTAVNNEIKRLKEKEERRTKQKLEQAKLFLKENGITELLEHNTKQQETELER